MKLASAIDCQFYTNMLFNSSLCTILLQAFPPEILGPVNTT